MINKESINYQCWLNYNQIPKSIYINYLKNIYTNKKGVLIDSAIEEINIAAREKSNIYYDEKEVNADQYISLMIIEDEEIAEEGFKIVKQQVNSNKNKISIKAVSEKGILYGVFSLLRIIQQNEDLDSEILDNPKQNIRMINHWDNIDGTIERGYAGSSIFFEAERNKDITKDIMNLLGNSAEFEVIRKAMNDKYNITSDLGRVKDYARMLASIGINSIVLNNTNVHFEETELITSRINIVRTLADQFFRYGTRVYLSANFAAPITLRELNTCDPLNPEVIKWWEEKIKALYSEVPHLGGFMVKADSEGREGPFTYGRNHAEGANMFARILKKYKGNLIWRCFVYNCKQDWRDINTDRAKAAYECFKELDGQFLDNVYLQIKNGPMDFQVREPISPLFGVMENTNKLLELQITQEYTGQQKHVCFLVPWWKEILDFNTYAKSDKQLVKERVAGIAAVANVGSDNNWTGNFLAQANLYGYGRLIWDNDLTSEKIAREWIILTLGNGENVYKNISYILLNSWNAYEKYTAPLGIGWMVTPANHYGPDVDGYEYSPWGTYNRADHKGIGIDRTIETGTGYVKQYNEPLCSLYNNKESCPDELKLFFHHLPYDFILNNGKTIIQFIYNTHFEGGEEVVRFIEKWKELKGIIPDDIFNETLELLYIQNASTKEWRDIINAYFHRISGIEDASCRKLY